jgi:hypothetical protein
VQDVNGNFIDDTRVGNVSDGGAFLTTPLCALPKFGTQLHVSLYVPRIMANTYTLEKFECMAKVLRHQPLKDTDRAGLALAFIPPQKLTLKP